MTEGKEANGVGLKVGLELHRQINTHKLFCNCPSVLRDDKPDIVVERWLHAVASETGEEDVVAHFEKGKGRHAAYEAYSNATCELELDEQPTNRINQEALQVALQICKMLNCTIVDQVQVMRKQVLDYSNTSGFQRTMLIGFNGWVHTTAGKVTIATVCLEEDAARKIAEDDQLVTYRLDRLGIPLIEIATGPDIHTPEQAKEVAAFIGMVMKSTNKMKSGLGTIRQDVNVSITGHPRVEIKGVQDLALIADIIRQEIERQQAAIKAGQPQTAVRKANIDGATAFLRPMPGASRLYPETDVPPIPITKQLLDSIPLPKLRTDRTQELMTNYHLSKELAASVLDSELFSELVKQLNLEPNFAARLIVEIPKDIKARLKLDTTKINDEDLRAIGKAVSQGVIAKEAAIDALADLCRTGTLALEKYGRASLQEIEQHIQQLLQQRPGLKAAALMGEVMKKYRGKADGKAIAALVGKYAQP